MWRSVGLSELCVVLTGRDGKPRFADIGLNCEAYSCSGRREEAEEVIGRLAPPGSMLLPGNPENFCLR